VGADVSHVRARATIPARSSTRAPKLPGEANEPGAGGDGGTYSAPSESRPAPPRSYDPVKVPVAPIREAVEDAIRAHTDVHQFPARGYIKPIGMQGATPLEIVADEIARYTGKRRSTVMRTLWRIRHGRDHWRGGAQNVKSVTFRVADEILCALHMHERWHTDPRLSEVYEQL
jgi:hypothetical protein